MHYGVPISVIFHGLRPMIWYDMKGIIQDEALVLIYGTRQTPKQVLHGPAIGEDKEEIG
jgi:hypothetical protein